MSPFCVILLGFFIVVIVVIVATIRFPLSCCRNKNLRDNIPNYRGEVPQMSTLVRVKVATKGGAGQKFQTWSCTPGYTWAYCLVNFCCDNTTMETLLLRQ